MYTLIEILLFFVLIKGSSIKIQIRVISFLYVHLMHLAKEDISKECSHCGELGKKVKGEFECPVCGYREDEKINTARNVKKRGQGDGVLNPRGSYSAI